ncbi:flagellar hook-associated protein 2 [Pseudomonas putida]|jgi:flagellar hook-associated protein 2|uniref:Flagellar hook-associated protein 2 n=1 Tax=Pseudomonas shirazica TaxID=1940636 RepID=A0ABY9SJI7_9PSED|nr:MULTISPECIES: flagellar filament capping protein FliD [Pseudomonas]GLO32111.1 flagellar hook-associated protein 2 [Pseudomonas putida]KYC19874.1 flagellar hook protein FliD [Pseudomonas sp. ABFPK]MBA6113473.1 flagellar filament capping protein FliD [Pseudomonas asiatica]UPK87235.1 flagellar hook protein FliD [Pseudomonas sp. A2]WMY83760.1 flagellar filament capping protein FliD [Pseudomonas shirazica]
MASPIASSTGLGSGLDIGSIVKVLVQSDTAAKQAQITRQTSNNSAMISGIGSLRSALTAFQTAMTKLNDKTAPSFNAYAATSANDKVVKVTSGNTAVAGSYDIQVAKLATGSKVASQAFVEGASKAIAAGTLTIEQGDPADGGTAYTIEVGAGATLQSVRDQINKEMSANGISANIITGEDGARLVLTSSKTGAGNDLSLKGDVDQTELNIVGTQKMVGTGAGYITDIAQDAELTIDGLKITSATNTISDSISGLSLELISESAAATKVTVAANNDGLKTSIQSFVDAYNTLQKAITSLTSTSRDDDDNLVLGPLTNDPTTRSLLGDIRKVLSEVGAGDQLTTLSQLGINTQKDGTLEFNSTKFAAAMNDKKLGAEVQELFTGTNGIFERMNKAIDPYNATDGSLASRNSALSNVAKNLSEQQAALDRRTDSLTESLTKKYVALDTALGKMKAQADQITSIFEAINAQAKKS